MVWEKVAVTPYGTVTSLKTVSDKFLTFVVGQELITYKYLVPLNACTPVVTEFLTAPTDDAVREVHGERLPLSKPPLSNGERAQTEELALGEAVVLVVNPDLVLNESMVETVRDGFITLEELTGLLDTTEELWYTSDETTDALVTCGKPE
jgi:hypothetical protein